MKNGNTAEKLEAEVRSITETILATGMPAPAQPTEHEVRRDYGPDATERLIAETTGAIERVCEATVQQFYASVTNAEEVTKLMRERADDFAQSLRAISKNFASEMADHLLVCRQALESFDQHSKMFEEKIAGLTYPRAATRQ